MATNILIFQILLLKLKGLVAGKVAPYFLSAV